MESDTKRIEMVLRAYQAYFRSLAFQELPKMAYQYLGEAGFVEVAEALARATIAALPALIEATKGLVEMPESKDPLDVLPLHFQCHSKAIEITGDQSIGLFRAVRESPNRLVFEAVHCPYGIENPLVLASYVGIVVGVLRALGAKAYALSKPESKKYIREGYVVWGEKTDETCRIVVEKIER